MCLLNPQLLLSSTHKSISHAHNSIESVSLIGIWNLYKLIIMGCLLPKVWSRLFHGLQYITHSAWRSVKYSASGNTMMKTSYE